MMKKVIFACLFASLTVSISQAQSTTISKDEIKKSGHYQHRTPEQRATRQTKLMTQSLNLNADQQAKVQALNLKRITEMEALRQTQKKDGNAKPNGSGNDGKAIRENWNNELKAILTPEQFAKYESQQAEMRNRRSELHQRNRRLAPTE